MSDIKHVGRYKLTNKKCIVAYRTLPGDAYNCLIIPTESLIDSYHDSLINLVESNTGQSAYEFAEAMSRTNFPDGTIMLAALHANGKLIKVPTDHVEMLPRPGTSILLSELNQYIAEQRGIPVDELSLKPSETKKENADVTEIGSVHDLANTDDVTKTSSASVNQVPEEPLTVEQQAKKYRSEADRLAKEAANFRRLAEDLVPTVKKSRAKA